MKKNKKKAANKSAGDKHLTYLLTLLTNFYQFLEGTPQPTDEAVRVKFVDLDLKWREYCTNNQLNPMASSLFNRQVALEWKKKMQEEPGMIGNATQPS